MFESQYLFQGDSVYSPWMSRQGDFMRPIFQAASLSANTDAGLEVFHKNSEDAGPGTLASTTKVTASDAGYATAEFSSLKELVRYKFFCTVRKGTSASDQNVLFRTLSPVWFDAVHVSNDG